jgi:hypothetical protein
VCSSRSDRSVPHDISLCRQVTGDHERLVAVSYGMSVPFHPLRTGSFTYRR